MSKKVATEVVDFNEVLEKKEFLFKYGEKEYSLVEATASDAAKFKNAVSACYRFDNDGKVQRVLGMGDAEMLLVVLCVRDSKGNRIKNPADVVAEWPSPMVSKLFEKAKEMSQIGGDNDIEALKKQREKLDELILKAEKEKAEVGNSQAPSTTDSE